jgi:large subunit ribosomal protein L6
MSRVGNKPVVIPDGVSIEIKDGLCSVKGPKGQLQQAIPRRIAVEIEDARVVVRRQSDAKTVRALHGLFRALLQNMTTGVKDGWAKKLTIHGIGYAAEVQGQTMTLRLGFSHPVTYVVPDGIKVEVDKATSIKVSGIDRGAVGQVAADIRGFRPPDAYKGKGIRYADETVRLKPGKAGAA